jgi:hypothetical protein
MTTEKTENTEHTEMATKDYTAAEYPSGGI